MSSVENARDKHYCRCAIEPTLTILSLEVLPRTIHHNLFLALKILGQLNISCLIQRKSIKVLENTTPALYTICYLNPNDP